MRRAFLGLCFMLGAVAPVLGASWVTNAFRTTSGDLVQRGDTMLEVLHSAGEPLHRRVLSVGITIGGQIGLTQEQWIYRGGDGFYIVTFAGADVQQIEVIADR